MKLAVLGGSFNPVHIGHMALADDVCSSLGYDRVLFVPAAATVKRLSYIESIFQRLQKVLWEVQIVRLILCTAP